MSNPGGPAMIVDVHAHCWPSLDCFSPSFQADARRMRVNAVNLVSRYEDYRASTAGEDVVTLVFGGKARLSGVWIDDHDVAAYVARDPGRMIGFMSLHLLSLGMTSEQIGWLTSLTVVGVLLFQIPVAWLADRSITTVGRYGRWDNAKFDVVMARTDEQVGGHAPVAV